MKKLLPITVATLVLVTYSPTAFSAFEGLSMMRMGDWEVDFSGNVNAFYTFVDCDGAGAGNPVDGGLACGSADGRDFDVNDVRTGLLPSWFNFVAGTETDNGWKTAVHLSFQPGVDGGNQAANGGIDGALGLNTSNFRQVFLVVGNDEVGTVKFGRDLGVFGSDAILNDMTLLGVGTVGGTTGGGNTSLGRIGVGYIYADWKAQVQYKSPDYEGFSFTVAIVDPWAALDAPMTAGSVTLVSGQGVTQAQDTPGFEGKINYSAEIDDETDLSLWASFIYQSIDFVVSQGISQSDLDATGWDLGAKISSGPFSLVGYYYDGEGIGTTGFMRDGLGLGAVELVERDSDGFYVQGTVTFPDTGTKLGLSYGESSLDLTGAEDRAWRDGLPAAAPLGNLVKSNSSWIAGVYHPVGEALNLVAESPIRKLKLRPDTKQRRMCLRSARSCNSNPLSEKPVSGGHSLIGARVYRTTAKGHRDVAFCCF